MATSLKFRSTMVECGGITATVEQHCARMKISDSTVYARRYRGCRWEEAFRPPAKKQAKGRAHSTRSYTNEK